MEFPSQPQLRQCGSLPHCARLGIEPSLHSNPSRGQSNSYPTAPRQELPLPSFNASSKQPLGQGAFPRGCLPQHPPVVAASSTSTQPTLCCLLSLLLMSGAALASSPFENYKAERREQTLGHKTSSSKNSLTMLGSGSSPGTALGVCFCISPKPFSPGTFPGSQSL